jgi:hypothetical protein
MKHYPPTPSLAMASFSSTRSSGWGGGRRGGGGGSGLLATRRRSRRAHTRTIIDNHTGRTSLAVTQAMAEPAVKRLEPVAAGNARRPTMTSAPTVAVTTTRPGTAGSPGIRVWPTWPKLKRESSLFLAHASPVLWSKGEVSEGEAEVARSCPWRPLRPCHVNDTKRLVVVPAACG